MHISIPLLRQSEDAIIKRHNARVTEARNLVVGGINISCFPDEIQMRYQKRFESAILKLARYAYTLPIVINGETGGYTSLFSHSIDTAIRMLKIEKRKCGNPDPHDHMRDIFAIFAAGICNKIGTIYSFDIRAGIDTQNAVVWKPHGGSLAEFADKHKNVPINAHYNTIHDSGGVDSYEFMNPQMLQWIFGASLFTWLGTRRIALLQISMLDHRFTEYHKQAQARTTIDLHEALATAHNRQNTADSPDAHIPDDPHYGSRSFSDDFVTAFRRNWLNPKIHYNSPTGCVLIGRTYTVLRIPEVAHDNTVFDLIFDEIGSYIRKNAPASFILTTYDDPNAVGIYEKDIFALRSSNPDPQYDWCIIAATSSGRTIRHQVFVQDHHTHAASWPCIIIRNDALWGEIDFSSRFAYCSLGVRFSDPLDQQTPTVNPLAVGFST